MKKLEGKTILIVDDDARNTYALVSYLETYGMKILTAEDGLKAITVLRQNQDINLVLMDMMMPEMDGYETIAAIQKEELLKKIPIIAVTAKAMKGDREKCLYAGAWDYVAKPIDMKLLIDKIEKLIIND